MDGMQPENSPSFQRVAELFLSRYCARASGGLRQEAAMRPDLGYQLLLKYALDPEFRIAVGRELSADLETAEWREELGFVLALELVLVKDGAWLYEQIVSKDRLSELEAIYPDVFARPDEGPRTAKELFERMLARREGVEPVLDALSRALDPLFPEGFETDAALSAMRRHGSFLNVEPDWMRELESFRSNLSAHVGKLLEKLGKRPEIDRDQAAEVLGRNATVEMLFCIASEAVLLRWFSTRDPGTQEKVLSASAPLVWDEGSLATAMGLRLSWEEGYSRKAAQAIMDGAEAYRQYGEGGGALLIYQMLVDAGWAEARSKAEAHNRMAVIHREEGRAKEAFLEFQEAGIIWEELGSDWESAVTGSFVAEGYYREGKRDKASDYLVEAFGLMARAREGDERMARGYFYLAACANSIGRFDLERRALEKGIAHAQILDDGGLFLEFNDRLLRLGR